MRDAPKRFTSMEIIHTLLRRLDVAAFLIRLRWLQVAVFLGCLLLVLKTHAGPVSNEFSYDVDSLVYASSEVIQGEIIGWQAQAGLSGMQIQITAVFKGSLEVGQKITVPMPGFLVKPSAVDRNGSRLESNDQLILFLTMGPSTLARNPFAGSAIGATPGMGVPRNSPLHQLYNIAPSGCKFVTNGAVSDVFDARQPQMYLSKEVRPRLLSLHDTAERLNASVKKTEVLAKRFGQPQTSEEVPWLLELLQERAEHRDISKRDHLAQIACNRMGSVARPEALIQALGLAKDYLEDGPLRRTLKVPGNRELLLAKVRDEKESISQRKNCAGLLLGIKDPKATPLDIERDNLQLAELAVEVQSHAELCLPMVRSVGHKIHEERKKLQASDQEISATLWATLHTLRSLHRPAASEDMKYEIEVALARADRLSYEELDSPCKTMISVLHAGNSAYPDATPDRGQFGYQYLLVSLDGVEADQVMIAFENPGADSSFALPIAKSLPFKGAGETNLSSVVTLPKDLKHGSYRAFLQIMKGGKIISVGHYSTVEL